MGEGGRGLGLIIEVEEVTTMTETVEEITEKEAIAQEGEAAAGEGIQEEADLDGYNR